MIVRLNRFLAKQQILKGIQTLQQSSEGTTPPAYTSINLNEDPVYLDSSPLQQVQHSLNCFAYQPSGHFGWSGKQAAQHMPLVLITAALVATKSMGTRVIAKKAFMLGQIAQTRVTTPQH